MAPPVEALERVGNDTPAGDTNLVLHDQDSNAQLIEQRFAAPDPAVDETFGSLQLVDNESADANAVETVHGQWTVIVDLAANLRPMPDLPNGAGASNKADELLTLAEQTKGTDVQFVVQAVEPVPAPEGIVQGTPAGHHGEDDNPPLTRYLIRDGQVIELYSGPSAGANQDLQDLLAAATELAPADHNALVIQSHGGGDMGINGDAGQIKLADLAADIDSAFTGGTNGSLDVLSFDACTMGQLAVLDAMQGRVDHIVASSEVEKACGEQADGQNLKEVFARLLADPDSTPAQLADTFIDVAEAGLNGDTTETTPEGTVENCDGTETLAHYDMQAMPKFEAALDDLGHQLAEAASSPENMAVLQNLILNAQVIPAPTLSGYLTEQNRDLMQVTQKLKEAIADGSLTDASGALSQSIVAFEAAHKELVDSYYGDQDDGYDRLGGLTAFLSDVTNTDPQQVWEREGIIGGIDSTLEHSVDSPAPFDRQLEGAQRMLAQKLKQMTDVLPAEFAGALDGVSDAIADVSNITESEFEQRLQVVRQAMVEFNATPAGAAVREQMIAGILTRMEILRTKEVAPEHEGWIEFLDQLAA